MDKKSFEMLYGDLPYASLPERLRQLLPEDKQDVQRARMLVELGYPTVAAAIPHLMIWLQDGNWPVAQIIAPFLASIGKPSIPEIKKILHGNDDIWKYWILTLVVMELNAADVKELEPELKLLAQTESLEELDVIAKECLVQNSKQLEPIAP